MAVLSFLLPYFFFFVMFSWASIGSFKAGGKAFKDNEIVFIGDKIITGKLAKILGYIFYLFSVLFSIFALSIVVNFIN
jgi:hypothetical protein